MKELKIENEIQYEDCCRELYNLMKKDRPLFYELLYMKILAETIEEYEERVCPNE